MAKRWTTDPTVARRRATALVVEPLVVLVASRPMSRDDRYAGESRLRSSLRIFQRVARGLANDLGGLRVDHYPAAIGGL